MLTHKADDAQFPTALDNDRPLPGRADAVGGEPLVTRAEHRKLEMRIEEQDKRIADLTNMLQAVIGRVADAERSVSVVGRACESIRRSVTGTPSDVDGPAMGFPTERPDEDDVTPPGGTSPCVVPIPIPAPASRRSFEDAASVPCASNNSTGGSDNINSSSLGDQPDQPEHRSPPSARTGDPSESIHSSPNPPLHLGSQSLPPA